MKKLFAISLIVLAGATIFTSCKKDDETTPAPSISFQNGTTSLVFTGANSVDVNVTFTAEGKIETVKLTGPSLTGTGTTTSDITSKMGTSGTDNAKNQTSATYIFQVSSADLLLAFANHTSLTYTFEVTDQNSNSTTGTFTVTMQAQNTPFATEYTDGVFYHIAGLLQGAYNLDGHAVVSSSGDETTKSMKNTDQAGSAFTGSWTVGTGNGTEYVKTTTAYADIYQENVAALYTGGTASATVTNPAANDVYIGKKGTTYYVISITAVEPSYSTNTGGNTGRITFKYKM